MLDIKKLTIQREKRGNDRYRIAIKQDFIEKLGWKLSDFIKQTIVDGKLVMEKVE